MNRVAFKMIAQHLFNPQQEKWLRRVEELFLRYGVKSLSMDDVSRELGISKKTLYQFVDNKDDLVSKVMDRHIQEQCKLDEEANRQAADAIDEMVTVIQNVVKEMQQMKPNLVHELQKYHREVWERIEKFQHEYIYKVAMENINWGRRDGLYRTEFDADIAIRFYIAGSLTIFNDQFFPKPPYTFEGLFKEFITNYLFGISTEKGRILLKMRLGYGQ
jgi:TetR/AcrR family transcriptional regulator, cholesterol catabolism regulator